MALSGVLGSVANAAVSSSSSEDLINSKKVRKPYTITKSRESWTEPEHDRFIEALQLFDRDWKKIEAFVGSKSVIQIRSHAQKYFLKVQKNGTSERVPPPRPKRKAAHPYPQKASQNDTTMPGNLVTRATTSSWPYSSVQPVGAPHRLKDAGDPSIAVADNSFCGSCTESSNNTWPTWDITDQGSQIPSLCGTPDFVQVYNFIGSVFDPSTGDHLQQLKDMAPVDAETVLSLMRNLSINLTSPDFEDQRMLLSSYDLDAEEVKAVCSDDPSNDDETASMSFMM